MKLKEAINTIKVWRDEHIDPGTDYIYHKKMYETYDKVLKLLTKVDKGDKE